MARAKKGVILLIVLGIVLVVAILAQVILSLILSHSRFTHHQTSRIQAYYAAMAGINYALEQLRTGSWVAGTNCCPGPPPCADYPCLMSFASGDFKPASLVGNSVSIAIRTAGSAGCLSPPAPAGSTCVRATADYIYIP